MKNSAVAHAVMVIDMQRAFVEGPGAIPRIGTVLPAARRQIEAARAAGALVVYLQNDGGAGEPDQPETAGWELAFEPQPGDVVVRKRHDNGFAGTDLDTLLRDHHVKTISICGVMSEMCVAATARSAMERGYEVVLAHDAHGTFHVPALASGDPEVPAELAARAAEWSLGDGVLIPLTSESVRFRTAIPEDPRDDPPEEFSRSPMALRERWPAAPAPIEHPQVQGRPGAPGPDRAGPLRAEQVPGATIANERISSD